ncbi:hypothetical protein Vafri_6574 [Volvox africanus]|uniref:non-specific serine/threonine protein kinase n=1 Tax=Volvox africanus TaxID=51714 RepID=A0A8J4AYA9_9CHLO|nr:hypothetical protein Vafri_6574 [Volvox africanus]GIL50350.1 hypothetical protein Vafri_6574 [Volvox africanus]
MSNLKTMANLPRIMGKYEVLEELGSGTFGNVRKVKNTETYEILAMKILKPDSDQMLVEREIFNHRLLEHPHIVEFCEVVCWGSRPCIVMEYANGGNLRKWVEAQGALMENQARRLFQQLIVAVDYCHKRGFAHRDIKPDNLMLHKVEGTKNLLLKMCDFGLSKYVSESGLSNAKVGTLDYMAPEVMDSRGRNGYDAKAADVWSCGVVLYVMLCGCFPFISEVERMVRSKADVEHCLLERMQEGKMLDHPLGSVTEQCIDMLRGMLEPEPEKRLTIEKIMEHPWFNIELPAEAREMNTTCLTWTVPPERQQPDQIKKLLQEARGVGGKQPSRGQFRTVL